MDKNENINIKLQIEKNQNSKELMLNIYFDKNASNFFIDSNTISWCPTNEEIDFINDVFKMISNHRGHGWENKLSTYKPKERDGNTEESSTVSDTDQEEDEDVFVQEDDESIVNRILKKRNED